MSEPGDITMRLRGRYPVGPIQATGEPEFGWRQFDNPPPIQLEAATEIECLRKFVQFVANASNDPGVRAEALRMGAKP